MGKKATKASRKYASSGQLKKEIQARKKHQQVKRGIERRKGGKPKGKDSEANGHARIQDPVAKEKDDESEGEDMFDDETGRFKGMSVDDFLKGGFMENGSEVCLQSFGSISSSE